VTSSDAIRVLHVRTVSGTGGGPDKTILKSCQHLASSGQVAEAFYMLDRRNDPGVVAERAKNAGVRLHTVLESGPFCVETLRAFRRVVSEGRFDLVHTHEYKSNVLTRMFRRKFGYKIVATAHGYNRTTLREYFYYRVERRMLRCADAVIAPTHEMAQRLAGFGVSQERLHIIPNGIEIAARERIAPKPRQSRVSLLYLGRLSEEKDPANLLQAMWELKRRNLDVELVLAGAGPERESLEDEVMSLGLAPSVTMPGHVADVDSLLASADILVSPSRTECMPNSLLEAMRSGVPVVATNVGGVGEMIRDGIDGLLCPPQDPAALADAIARLIADPLLARRLAESARERVAREFNFEKYVEATLALYRRLLS